MSGNWKTTDDGWETVKCPHCGAAELLTEGSIPCDLAICRIGPDLRLSYYISDSKETGFEVNDWGRVWCHACDKDIDIDDVYDQAPQAAITEEAGEK